MPNIPQLLHVIVDRIRRGEVVPVKKEFTKMVAEELEDICLPHTIIDEKTNPNRMLFRRFTPNQKKR